MQPSSAEDLPETGKGLEGTLLDGVANMSRIIKKKNFFLCDRLMGIIIIFCDLQMGNFNFSFIF